MSTIETTIAIIDVETNGLNVVNNDILSLAIMILDIDYKGQLNEGDMFFNMSDKIVKVLFNGEYYNNDENVKNNIVTYHINRVDDTFRIQNGAPMNAILGEIKPMVQQCTAVYAYNRGFDKSFIEKYDRTFFENVNFCEASTNIRESVINAIQRVVYERSNSFTNMLKLKGHMHQAITDVYVEAILVLGSKYGYDVSSLIVPYNEYPKFGFKMLKNCNAMLAPILNIGYVDDLINNRRIMYERSFMRTWAIRYKPIINYVVHMFLVFILKFPYSKYPYGLPYMDVHNILYSAIVQYHASTHKQLSIKDVVSNMHRLYCEYSLRGHRMCELDFISSPTVLYALGYDNANLDSIVDSESRLSQMTTSYLTPDVIRYENSVYDYYIQLSRYLTSKLGYGYDLMMRKMFYRFLTYLSSMTHGDINFARNVFKKEVILINGMESVIYEYVDKRVQENGVIIDYFYLKIKWTTMCIGHTCA